MCDYRVEFERDCEQCADESPIMFQGYLAGRKHSDKVIYEMANQIEGMESLINEYVDELNDLRGALIGKKETRTRLPDGVDSATDAATGRRVYDRGAEAQPADCPYPEGWKALNNRIMTRSALAITALNSIDCSEEFHENVVDLATTARELVLHCMRAEAQPEGELPGMWEQADFTDGDPDDRSYAQRERDAEAQLVEREAWAWKSGRHEHLSFDQPDPEVWRNSIRKVMVREIDGEKCDE